MPTCQTISALLVKIAAAAARRTDETTLRERTFLECILLTSQIFVEVVNGKVAKNMVAPENGKFARPKSDGMLLEIR
jgi:hypothetical protein